MELSKTEFRQLMQALMAAFPDYSSVKKMVFLGLGVNLDEITQTRNLDSAILDLMLWAKSKGTLANLVSAAHEENPGNPELQAFSSGLRATGSSSPVRQSIQDQPVAWPVEDRNQLAQLIQQSGSAASTQALSALLLMAGLDPDLYDLSPGQIAFVRATNVMGNLWQRDPSGGLLVRLLAPLCDLLRDAPQALEQLAALGERANPVPGPIRSNEGNHELHAFKSRSSAPSNGEWNVLQKLALLDFEAQEGLARRALEAHRIGAFLVYDENDTDVAAVQRVLARRLRRRFCTEDREPIKICAGSVVGTSIDALWGQIRKALDLEANSAPDQIIRKILECWDTQHMVFIFYPANFIVGTREDRSILNRWLREFWVPLVSAAQDPQRPVQAGASDRETYLLLILVDFTGEVNLAAHVELADECDHPRCPIIPIRIPQVGRISRDALYNWRFNQPDFDRRLPGIDALLQNSDNGIPFRLYGSICDSLGTKLEGVLEQWDK